MEYGPGPDQLEEYGRMEYGPGPDQTIEILMSELDSQVRLEKRIVGTILNKGQGYICSTQIFSLMRFEILYFCTLMCTNILLCAQI